MHRRAEYGVAAHWKYKEEGLAGATGPSARSGNSDQRHGLAAPAARLAAGDIRPGRVPRVAAFRDQRERGLRLHAQGAARRPARRVDPVDFAYAVHTEVGHHCIGARVNGRLVPLESTLDNGDLVEVLTSRADTAGPSRDWLHFVKSARARHKIKQWFTRERREEMVEDGKEALAKAMRKKGVPLQRLASVESLTGVAEELHLIDIDGLYAAIGEGHVSAQHVVSRLLAAMGGEEGGVEDLAETTVTTPGRPRRSRSGDPGVVVKGMSDVYVKLARCCTPVPGDEILGFVTRGNGVSIHRRNCTNAESLLRQSEKIIDVEWAPTASSVFLVQLHVEALDRSRLLSDVTRVLSDSGVNILSASVTTSRNRVAALKFTFEMGDPGHLDHVIRTVRKVDGVLDVQRDQGGRD
jgi:guanosine-3',5'-bis(diphosphate) 3'-pyrophosphohydrolase